MLVDFARTPSQTPIIRGLEFFNRLKYYKEAGIKKKASVHTLRHTFSTHQIHNGLKINQLKEVLGHRRMETTYKYVHLDRTNLRAEMEQGAL
jgi:site-specific recombinase XerD